MACGLRWSLHSENTRCTSLTEYPTQRASDLKRSQYCVFQEHGRLQHPPGMMYSSPAVQGGGELASKTFYCPRPLPKEETQSAPSSSGGLQCRGIKDEQPESTGEPCHFPQRLFRPGASPPGRHGVFCILLSCMVCFLVLQTMDHIVRIDGVFFPPII